MIPEQAREYIGRVDPPIVLEVDTGAIRRYAAAVGNDNPLYFDDEYACRSRYSGIIAPPGFFGWPIKPTSSSTGLPDLVADLQAALAQGGFARILDGGISYEFYLPVRPGDTIVASPKVKDLNEKQGKSGAMIVCDLETTYLNQNGDVVAKSYQTFIAR